MSYICLEPRVVSVTVVFDGVWSVGVVLGGHLGLGMSRFVIASWISESICLSRGNSGLVMMCNKR